MNKPSGKLAFAYATIANLEEKIAGLESAQPAPVAVSMSARSPEPASAQMVVDHICLACGDPSGHYGLACPKSNPIAVLLPDRKEEEPYWSAELCPDGDQIQEWAEAKIWNACLDEVTRLNSTRPAHASPPPGAELCDTHRDNDGLDDWRKP